MPLSTRQVHALGSQMLGASEWFSPGATADLTSLLHELDRAVEAVGGTAFVRLSSRSPKDGLQAMRQGLSVRSGLQGLSLFLQGSPRCAADLRMSLDTGVGIAMVVRPWLDFEPWQELRVFVREGCFAGASLPQGMTAATQSTAQSHRAALQALASLVADELMPQAPGRHAAFDIVAMNPGRDSKAYRLLDANPLRPGTGLGCFASLQDLDGRLAMQHRRVGVDRTSR